MGCRRWDAERTDDSTTRGSSSYIYTNKESLLTVLLTSKAPSTPAFPQHEDVANHHDCKGKLSQRYGISLHETVVLGMDLSFVMWWKGYFMAGLFDQPGKSVWRLHKPWLSAWDQTTRDGIGMPWADHPGAAAHEKDAHAGLLSFQ